MIHKNLIVFTAFVALVVGAAMAAGDDKQVDVSIDDRPVQLISVGDDIDATVGDSGDNLYSLSRVNANGASDANHVFVWIE